MDAMGVDRAVVFPTLFNEYLPLVENPEAAAALGTGYNDWIWDFAAQTHGRVHPVAILPMHSLLLARRRARPRRREGFHVGRDPSGLLHNLDHRRALAT